MATETSRLPAVDVGDTLRRSPAGASDLFPRPPLLFEDREGRRIEIRAAGTVAESLVSMYDEYDPADRSRGLPPLTESKVRDWLDRIFETGLHLVAWHDREVVGHATLVPAGDDSAELGIFVASGYQQAGIGSRLLRTLLGHGRANGVDRVWLTVDHDNRAAIALYRKTGFRTTETGIDTEMERRL